jgi:hypothetical protein
MMTIIMLQSGQPSSHFDCSLVTMFKVVVPFEQNLIFLRGKPGRPGSLHTGGADSKSPFDRNASARFELVHQGDFGCCLLL